VSSDALLSVEDLRVSFATEGGLLQAVDGVSFELRPGEVLAIVGESGSGKSVTAQTIMGLTRSKNARIEGSVELEGHELIEAGDAELRSLRGDRIAMIFQDPMTSFNPVYRLGNQIVEAIRTHRPDVSKADAKAQAVELFESVGIPNAQRRVDSYPHEFSGGMRQRAMIAMALALEPDVLIADEPTTALDVTIQAQILQLIKRLKREHETTVLFITHDFGVVAEIADRVLVMYAGRCVEAGSVRDVFYDPQHPYTWGLLASIPAPERGKARRLPSIEGSPPSLIGLPAGCPFSPRCAFAFDRCRVETPAAEERAGVPGHLDACWLTAEEKARRRAGVLAVAGDMA
jgi:oligopeptide/dipeptide ABC transporter ATP-binding protein